MSTVTINELIAIRTASELKPLAAYIDAHDAGRVPANALGYQAISQKIKLLLAPHVDNPHVRMVCTKSQSLCEILGNLLLEQERELALQYECALEELKLTAYKLQ
jgi:hypothetical protein